MKRTIALSLALVLLVLGTAATVHSGARSDALSAPARQNQAVAQTYAVGWWTIDGGGAFRSGGGDFALSATIGQTDANSNLQGGDFTMSTGFWTYSIEKGYSLYLPIVLLRVSDAPDLIVESIVAHPDSVTITIRNQGMTAVTQIFWVDLYVNPNPPPTEVNQTWPALSSEGLAWGVRVPALPIGPDETRVLTVDDPYFAPEYSYVDWPLEIDTPIYVQVDSADATTNYGAVLESHEIVGGPYNNILGPVLVTPGGERAHDPVAPQAPPAGLPPRP